MQLGLFQDEETKVVNVKSLPKGWQQDSRYVYIGRAWHDIPESKWHNPFRMPNPHDPRHREGVIKMFRNYLVNKPALLRDLPELRGKILVCHCHPEACHGDVLIELLDELKRS